MNEDFQDSGPFCQHWGDSDCDECRVKCDACGHDKREQLLRTHHSLQRNGDTPPTQQGREPCEWSDRNAGVCDWPCLGDARTERNRVSASYRVIATVEREVGASLGELTRVQKQQAVRLLEEHGAFTLRKSIEDVADAMGVSRITIYNYLNAIRGAEED